MYRGVCLGDCEGWDGFYESDAIMVYGREKVINSRCLLEMENEH